MDKGTYILLIENDTFSTKVGSLGTILFRNGWHAYVGSALGPGGLTRVRRHLNLNLNKNKKPRWHIDYLLIRPDCSIRRIYCITTDKRIECLIACKMEGEIVSGFGSSDCSCTGHLFYYPADPDIHLQQLLQDTSREEHTGSEPWIFLGITERSG